MWEPTSIVFGVRHKKRFAFLDNAGEVLDSVLEMQEAGELPQGVLLEEVGWQKTTARLVGAKGGVTIDFDVDGIVLTVEPSRSRLARNAAKRLFLIVAQRVLQLTGGDGRVNRIGTLENYRLDHRASGEVAIATLTTLGGLGTSTDVAMRLSFRSATEEGLASRGIEDWRNTIIQVWNRQGEVEPDQSHLNVSIDYQTYFSPERTYDAGLVEEHDRRFLERLEVLQSGRLVGLASEQVAR